MTTTLGTSRYNILDAAGLAFSASVLPAAGATRRSEIVKLGPQTSGEPPLIGLWLRYTGGASASGAYPHVRVWLSASGGLPADYTDTSWHLVGVTDGSVTEATAYAGGTALNGLVSITPDLVKIPGVAAAVVMSIVVPLKVPGAAWLYVEAAETGDTTHPGTLIIGLTQS